ncbi:hypothetical protein C0993_009023, partial [Termitomyces sp. T159_Od127]
MEQSLLASTVDLRQHLQEVHAQLDRQQGKLMMVTMDWDRAWQDQDVVLAAVKEHEEELVALWAQVVELKSRVVRTVPGKGEAVRLAWVAEQEAVQWRDWALVEAASSQEGILWWVQEHWLLLDGASAAQALLWDGIAWMPFNLPMELDHGLAQLELLLVGHWQQNAIAPGSWMDVAVDAGESLLLWEDHLVSLVAQMEMAVVIKRLAARGSGEMEGSKRAVLVLFLEL